MGLLIGWFRWATFSGSGVAKDIIGADTLRGQAWTDRFDAEKLIELTARYPKRPEPLIVQAEVQWRDEDWERLLGTSGLLMRRFPGLVIGYRSRVAALIAFQRMDEADEIARMALRRFPRSPDGHSALAQLHMARGEYDLAARHLRKVIGYGTDQGYARLTLCRALKAMNHLEEAEAVISHAVTNFPKEIQFWREYASLAEFRLDWPVAIERWMQALIQIDSNPEPRIRAAEAMRHAGRLGDALGCIRDAAFMFPNSEGVRSAHERIQQAMRDAAPGS